LWHDLIEKVERETRSIVLFLVGLYNFTEIKNHEGMVENGGYVVVK
jgi:hypothetical protein